MEAEKTAQLIKLLQEHHDELTKTEYDVNGLTNRLEQSEKLNKELIGILNKFDEIISLSNYSDEAKLNMMKVHIRYACELNNILKL